jgi:hypothetical protein
VHPEPILPPAIHVDAAGALSSPLTSHFHELAPKN